ncbi:MAG TPA: hypothetical protein VE714_09770, partial [Gemmatimonadales bacterium]|nr:hypothetical protein [Gemmatimonadales bacterium]
MSRSGPVLRLLVQVLYSGQDLRAQRRLMQPEDLFRIERVEAISWSPDRSRAAVELDRSDRWLDPSIPSGQVTVVDAAVGTLRRVSPASREFVGFFGAAWSPDSRRLLF